MRKRSRPHPDQDAERRDDTAGNRPQPFDREDRHRNHEVDDDHRPVERRERAFWVTRSTAISADSLPCPDGEALGEDEVAPQQAHHQQQLAEVLEVQRVQILLEVQELAERGHRDDQARRCR